MTEHYRMRSEDYHRIRAEQQIAETGRVEYETMRMLLGLTPGHRIVVYRVTTAGRRMMDALSRAMEATFGPAHRPIPYAGKGFAGSPQSSQVMKWSQ